MCRCTSDNRYVYGGDDCSKKGETLKLSSEYIIGIGGGVGGGVVLILVIALIVTCCRRSKPDPETDRKSVESFRSDINDTTHAKDRSGSSAYQDPYNEPYERRYENMRRQDSGLPEQDKFEADFRSSAPRAPDAAARSDKPSFQRMQRETNEVMVYSPEVSPFFRNQAYESFPEPGHFTAARQGEVYPSRGVQRPFQRQPSDTTRWSTRPPTHRRHLLLAPWGRKKLPPATTLWLPIPGSGVTRLRHSNQSPCHVITMASMTGHAMLRSPGLTARRQVYLYLTFDLLGTLTPVPELGARSLTTQLDPQD
ncbi:uncharacterized protein LOC112562083 [Pomacea canaliculata]|uniref:uncharacterized protein LOC112562083 n=1 Tax=Pomacea canaliculata TaxID=400727 RepID=UPI000D725B50|nr:uncharacterized protein LOC112562083 [Pomacea canaliculata]